MAYRLPNNDPSRLNHPLHRPIRWTVTLGAEHLLAVVVIAGLAVIVKAAIPPRGAAAAAAAEQMVSSTGKPPKYRHLAMKRSGRVVGINWDPEWSKLDPDLQGLPRLHVIRDRTLYVITDVRTLNTVQDALWTLPSTDTRAVETAIDAAFAMGQAKEVALVHRSSAEQLKQVERAVAAVDAVALQLAETRAQLKGIQHHLNSGDARQWPMSLGSDAASQMRRSPTPSISPNLR